MQGCWYPPYVREEWYKSELINRELTIEDLSFYISRIDVDKEIIKNRLDMLERKIISLEKQLEIHRLKETHRR